MSWKTTKYKPTCEKEGYEEYDFDGSIETVRVNTKSPLGHKWSSWKVVEKPADDWEGVKTRMCRRCGKLEAKSLEKEEYADMIKEKIKKYILLGIAMFTVGFAAGFIEKRYSEKY